MARECGLTHKCAMRNGRILRSSATGALFGAILLGLGGRVVMRLLTMHDGREPGFSFGGTLEIMLYGAIIGLVAGLVFALLPAPLRKNWIASGLIFGLLVYAGTILTLPAHIAGTAAPFSDILPLVLFGFGLCFLAFGLALARTLQAHVAHHD